MMFVTNDVNIHLKHAVNPEMKQDITVVIRAVLRYTNLQGEPYLCHASPFTYWCVTHIHSDDTYTPTALS